MSAHAAATRTAVAHWHTDLNELGAARLRVYGGQHATYELGWIVERTDLLPLRTAPARTRVSHTITGSQQMVELPAHSAPADDGWRAKVELTDAGRAALGRATNPAAHTIERP